jgi:hypothetical protein
MKMLPGAVAAQCINGTSVRRKYAAMKRNSWQPTKKYITNQILK